MLVLTIVPTRKHVAHSLVLPRSVYRNNHRIFVDIRLEKTSTAVTSP